MLLRYLFKQVVLPPGIFFLLLLFAWFLRRRFPRLAAGCFVAALGGLGLSSLPISVEWVAPMLESEPVLAQVRWEHLSEQADAIVILGGGRHAADPAWGGEQPSFMALERIRYGARLARASGLPVAVSGGLHFGRPPSEATLMAEVLRHDFGVPVHWREETSRTTWENAQQCWRMLQAEGVKRVVLVTQAWHMPRARWSFEQQGFTVIAAPVGFSGGSHARPFGGWLPESRAFAQSALLFNELLGGLVYPLLYGR
jgi:uncharacterized SAM-binding protein YcdF (DUF218 family)